MTKKKDDTRYSVKDKSVGSFQLRIMLEYAETLGMMAQLEDNEKKVLKGVEFLQKMLPVEDASRSKRKDRTTASTGSMELDEDDVSDYTDDFDDGRGLVKLTEENQSATLSLCHFLIISNGVAIDRVLPQLLSLLKALPRCKWNDKGKLTPDFFTYHFVSLMREIGNNLEQYRAHINEVMCGSTLTECQRIMRTHEDAFLNKSKNGLRIMYGLFKAFSEGLPREYDSRLLIELIQDFIGLGAKHKDDQNQLKPFANRLIKSMMIIVIKVMLQLSKVETPNNEENLKLFIKNGYRNVNVDYVHRVMQAKSQNLGVKLFSNSIDLIVSCAKRLKDNNVRDACGVWINLLDHINKHDEQKAGKDLDRIQSDIIGGIESLCKADPTQVGSAARALREFIEKTPSPTLRETAINAFCAIVSNDFQKNGLNGTATHAITTVSNTIYLDKEEKSAERNSKRILLLTRCALAINDNRITEIINPVLTSYFVQKKQEGTSVESALQLAAVAHLGDSYRDVVDLIFGIYQHPTHSPDTSLGTLLSKCIRTINGNLNDPEKQMNLLVKSLKLFNKLAEQIQAANVLSGSKGPVVQSAVHIGVLLPAIAAQLQTAAINARDPDTNIQKLFRITWFYCVLFSFVDENAVTGYNDLGQDFYENCLRIASFAPLLLRRKAYNFLETEKELNVLIENSKLKTPADFQTKLAQIVGEQTIPISVIRKFTFSQTLFLINVYYLEAMRVRSGSLEFLLCYLEDHSLANMDPEFTKCLKAVTDQVFNKWKDYVNLLEIDLRTKLVEEQTHYLFKSFVNRNESVRRAAMDYISQITKNYQHVFWSEQCIRTLLDLTAALHEGTEVGNTTKVVAIEIPAFDSAKSEIIYLPENFTDTKKLLEKITKLTLDWIKGALSFAPNIVQGALEDYVSKFQNSLNGSLQHIGYSLAVYLATPQEYVEIGLGVASTFYKDKRRGLSTLNENRSYSMTQSIAIKSYHSGEIHALKELLQTGNRDIEKLVVKKLNEIVKKYTTEQNLRDAEVLIKNNDEVRVRSCLITHRGDPAIKDFNHYMQLATAYIINEKELQMNLMQWLIWTPIFLFTREAFQTAIFCWKWLATARPEFEVNLLTEMYHAWVYTINQGIGLFSGTRKHNQLDDEDDIIELAVQQPQKRKSHLKDDIPHRLWTNYLAERFQALQGAEGEVVVIFINLLMRSFEDVRRLSRDHGSLGSRFRLCLLGTIVSRRAESYDFSGLSLLRDRVHGAILNYFQLHPTWYDPGSIHTVQEDIRVLEELEQRLRYEKSQVNKSGNNHTARDIDDNISTRSGGSGHSRAYSVHGGSVFGLRPSPSVEQLSVVSGGSGGARRKATYTSETGELGSQMVLRRAGTSVVLPSAYSSVSAGMIDLILVLIEHERTRMNIWKDPRNSDADLVNAQPVDPLLSKWKAHVRTAWNFSPQFALQMAIRFPMDVIRIELQRLVRQHAAEVTHLHEAVTYLVTPQTIEEDITEFQYLLYWAPSTLSTALTFLNFPYVKNPLVGQYAIRTLRRFLPEAVVFYLPQLIQCLRHDASGQLNRYLISLVKQNVMFTHQLIWTLRTEIIDHKNLTEEEKSEIKPAEEAISEICHKLYIQVLGELVYDERAKRLYEEEFSFFDEITEISGALVPYPKEEREEKLVQMVKERILNKDKPLTKNLYTPTNTQCRIKYFNPEKAITLKSAKKVPILIPFYVKERPYGLDIGQDTEDTEVVDMDNPDLTGLIKQPCIFKMGDDCRQDQLALQIISMFKRIFENLNLPLYLYPYRVITTGRGMGIIECVPNTMSRHQLGVYTEGDLYDYFIKKYGHEESVEFQIARKNFIESMAAYSVVSYILNIKDRHNGNILVDEDGHLVHIDFGFIFDTTPGGNYGIERQVPFKLTTEMLLIMGERFDKSSSNAEIPFPTSLTTDGLDTKPMVQVTMDNKDQQHAEPFNLFVDLVVRGFLAARDHMHSIVSIVEVMLQSELPCFTKDAIKNLKFRFCADKSEKEAVKFIKEKIDSSYKNMFSVIYDKYQQRFEGVNC